MSYMYKICDFDIEVIKVIGIIIKDVANFLGRKTVL
jgi:hypothetical protein